MVLRTAIRETQDKRLSYKEHAISYHCLSCLVPCYSHIISNSMWSYKRKVVVEEKKIV
jgi:hypothetical protein